MNLLINFIPIKKGGGQQVATNFIRNIELAAERGFKVFICCTEGTEVHKLLKNLKKYKYYIVPNSLFGRAYFSYISFNKIVKDNNINIVYTMFGPSLPKRKDVLNVIGCAYSNIFYPEINFWNNWPIKKRLKSKIIDYYRLKNTLNADAIIFENESMLQRARMLFNYSLERSTFIKPSLSSHFLKNDLSCGYNFNMTNHVSSKQILLLTGWHLNKNLQALPSIANSLKRYGVKDVVFTITISPEHPGASWLLQEAKKLNVEQYLSFVGTVSPFELDKLYNESYAVMLLSLLESFSNNIIESWAMNRPIIISDLEWARSICKNAAYYVNREDPNDVARGIVELINSSKLYEKLVEEGRKELTTYPSPLEKVKLQFEFIQKLYEKRT